MKLKLTLLTLIMTLMFPLAMFSQSVYTAKHSQSEGVTTKDLSLRSPWMYGSKFTTNVNGEQGLSSNFLFAQKVIYSLYESEDFVLPAVAVANVAGGGDPLSGDSGYNLGLYPYYIASTSDRLDIVIHGVAAYKTLPVDSLGFSLEQLRFSIGIEGAFYGTDRTSSLPVTISVGPVFQTYSGDSGDVFENIALLEATFVVPIAEKLGILAELQAPFDSEQFETAFRIGLMAHIGS